MFETEQGQHPNFSIAMDLYVVAVRVTNRQLVPAQVVLVNKFLRGTWCKHQLARSCQIRETYQPSASWSAEPSPRRAECYSTGSSARILRRSTIWSRRRAAFSNSRLREAVFIWDSRSFIRRSISSFGRSPGTV